jgi:hypothetical protein
MAVKPNCHVRFTSAIIKLNNLPRSEDCGRVIQFGGSSACSRCGSNARCFPADRGALLSAVAETIA